MPAEKKVLNTSSIGILAYKSSGKCVFANHAAAEKVDTQGQGYLEKSD